ncbi:DUF4097 family beta strand repeat-containing protein [Alkalibacillus aidingensis]|uniref:DUF4097 family beta strand repeat-containing protein n=1 Tax=Alkalibacillus aidingensis TaxID=2747607 RepID=UPI0016606F00|nr:DUF4097 family beta strand repeat-containing protein [Alkalibacillus aidingensis]
MSEKRRKILNLLEEGHITAEEADEWLEALDQAEAKESQTNTEKTSEKQESSGDFSKTLKRDLKNFTEGIFNFIDDTFQRVKDGPFEFSFNHSVVKRTYDYSKDHVKHLNIDLANGTLEFIPTEEENVEIYVKAKVFKETDQDRADRIFDQSFSISNENDMLKIEQDRKDISIDLKVHLPKQQYENVFIKTINGSIKAHGIIWTSARISTVNGSVKMFDFTGETLYVDTKHGSVRMDETKLSKVKLDTVTGSVFYDGEVDQINTNVTTGSVRVYVHNDDARHADLNVATGSIQLYVPKDMYINGTASTTVSSVDIDLPRAKVKRLDEQMMKKVTQFIYAEEGEEYFDVDLSTKTGSIRVYNISK